MKIAVAGTGYVGLLSIAPLSLTATLNGSASL